jgi:hypothetical protein
MQLTNAFMLLSYVAGSVLAQTDTTSLGERESAVTVVETSYEVYTSTAIDQSVYITSLPKSLYTHTTEVPIDTTLVPVMTPSTVYGASTYVVHTVSGIDAQQSETTVIPTGATVIGGANGGSGSSSAAGASFTASRSSSARTSSGTAANGANAASTTASTSTSTGGAQATIIPAGMALAMLGFAAAL